MVGVAIFWGRHGQPIMDGVMTSLISALGSPEERPASINQVLLLAAGTSSPISSRRRAVILVADFRADAAWSYRKIDWLWLDTTSLFITIYLRSQL